VEAAVTLAVELRVADDPWDDAAASWRYAGHTRFEAVESANRGYRAEVVLHRAHAWRFDAAMTLVHMLEAWRR
jgi:hypothetical protein